MDLQRKERQDQTAAAPAPQAAADTDKKSSGNELRGMNFAEGEQKLAPGAGAGAGKPDAKADDEGGPGTTVVRDEKPDKRLGPPKAAVKIAVKDTQVDENQTANLKVEANDPEAPGQTNQLWFNWAHTGGPNWEKASGTYKPELSFTAPEVEQDDELTGEVSVAKRGYLKVKGVTTKKPFSVKVKEVAKPEPKEEAPPAPPVAEEKPAEEQKPEPQKTPAEEAGKPGNPVLPDLASIAALLAALGGGKKEEPQAPPQPQAPAPVTEAPAPEAHSTTPVAPAPQPEAPAKEEEPAAPEAEVAPAPPAHHHHHHHHRRPRHRHHYLARRHRRHRKHHHLKHRRHLRHRAHKHHLPRHHYLARRHKLHHRHHHLKHRGHAPLHHRGHAPHLRHPHHAPHLRHPHAAPHMRPPHHAPHHSLMQDVMRGMGHMIRHHHAPTMPHIHAPKPKPHVHRPPWMQKPKLKPQVTAPAAKSLQGGERGTLSAKVVDPDQGKLGGPRVEWRQDKGTKLEKITGQGTPNIEFTAPKVSQKATLTGIVLATDADGLHDQKPFTITVEPTVAAGEKALAWGDPHFVGGDGGKYDIMGKPGGTYNLLSDTGVRVTGLMKRYNREDITVFDQGGVTVTGKGPKGVVRNNIQYMPGKGATVDGKALGAGKMTPLADGGSALYIGGNLHIDTREGYKVTFLARKSGAISYLDVEIKTGARGVGTGGEPDGLMGQTFDADNKAKNGKKGAGAQGEGAIAGVVGDYETAGLFGAGKGKHAKAGMGAATDERRLFRKTVLVNANPGLGAYGFVDSGIQVQPGDNIMINASGQAGENRKLNRGPDGDARYSHPRKSAFMSPAAPAFSLVGRVAGEKTGFMVGSNFKGGVKKPGKLELAFNDLAGTFGDNVGYYLADVQVVKGVV